MCQIQRHSSHLCQSFFNRREVGLNIVDAMVAVVTGEDVVRETEIEHSTAPLMCEYVCVVIIGFREGPLMNRYGFPEAVLEFCHTDPCPPCGFQLVVDFFAQDQAVVDGYVMGPIGGW